ncbi:hypothetical protein FOZ63_017005 [Perkinsus olseni]|uniref:Ubiquitin-like protein ATG12 n=1 Tax=Perkinsus olseni TaxID=32597 RepID=A0A7J6Q669_PEROL|nr:hypothetical protein FOZ63_017005 [Perkinsus olseni]KAF4737362.1 hypothetical protein FOZ62_017576 [Perkinsus olseni]
MDTEDERPAHDESDYFRKLRDFKVTVQLFPIGNAPPLKQCKFAMAGATPVRVLMKFLEGAVTHSGVDATASPDVHVYVNNFFCPMADQIMGDLCREFGRVDRDDDGRIKGGSLKLHYSVGPAYA